MVDLIFKKLFAYGDLLAQQKRPLEREIVHNCEGLIHQAFLEAESVAVLCKGKKPEDKIEELVLSIPGIRVKKDVLDNSYYYELDAFHFDKPVEVLKYVIRNRDSLKTRAENRAKAKRKGEDVL